MPNAETNYNAMSMDFDGNLYDYYGGMDDLQDRVSRFVGDPAERTPKEDYCVYSVTLDS